MIIIPDDHAKTIEDALREALSATINRVGWDESRGRKIAAIRAAIAAMHQPPPSGQCFCRCDACKYCEQLLEPDKGTP